MQKKYADFKLGVPDYVTVETEEERLVCQGGQTTVAAGATTVEFQDEGDTQVSPLLFPLLQDVYKRQLYPNMTAFPSS